jgi:hypothetical protein
MNNKIVIRLVGGLGNQLFQLQYAQKFARLKTMRLCIDDSFFRMSRKPHEILGCEKLISEFEIITLSRKHLLTKRFVERVFYKFKSPTPKLLKPEYIFENEKCDICDLMPNRHNIVIDGFWQDKKYLDPIFIEQVQLKMLKICNISQSIKETKVCMHVRRGDYLTNKNYFRLAQNVLDINYYFSAMRYMKDTRGLNKFHLYTDDEIWAQQFFGSDDRIEIIKSSELSPVELLTGMSEYSNFIIANSTLSWWAAVLSSCSTKFVIIPKQWSINIKSDKYCLKGWLML